jgi:hypothetical protein
VKTICLALGMLLGSTCLMGLSIPSAFGASSVAETVSNGIQCRAAPGQYDDFSRDQKGIQNIQSATRRVYCPLNTPSYDTDRTSNPQVSWVKIYVNSSGPSPICYIYTMSQEGMADQKAGDLDQESDYPARTVRFPTRGYSHFVPPFGSSCPPVDTSSPACTASIGYVCDVPAGGRIYGARAQFPIPEIVGGAP